MTTMTRDEARTLLGVAPGADQATIRAAFRRQIRRVHPDLCPVSEARQRGVEAAHIFTAWHILSGTEAATPDPVPSSGTADAAAPSPADEPAPSYRYRPAEPAPSSQAPDPAPSYRAPDPAPSYRAADPAPEPARPASPARRSRAFPSGTAARVRWVASLATGDPIGRWVAVAVTLALAVLLEGPASHGLVVLLFVGALLVVQAVCGGRERTSPAGVVAAVVGTVALALVALATLALTGVVAAAGSSHEKGAGGAA